MDLPNVDSVQRDASADRSVEARQEIDQRALSPSRRTNQSDDFPALHLEAHASENGLLTVVSEVDVFVGHFALETVHAATADRHRFDTGVEDLEEAFSCGERGLRPRREHR